MRKTQANPAPTPVTPFEKLGKPAPGVNKSFHALRTLGAPGLRKAMAMINRLGALEPHWLDDPDARATYLYLDHMAQALEAMQQGVKRQARLRITKPDDTVVTVTGYKAAAEITGRTVMTLRQAISNNGGKAHFMRKGSGEVYTVERA